MSVKCVHPTKEGERTTEFIQDNLPQPSVASSWEEGEGNYEDGGGDGRGLPSPSAPKFPHPRRGTKKGLSLRDKPSVCFKARDAAAFRLEK